ncbi:MAG: hypothetical protein AAF989_14425 [Planctomycetota bacterium]
MTVCNTVDQLQHSLWGKRWISYRLISTQLKPSQQGHKSPSRRIYA